MLAPTIPARTALASIAGVRMVVPSSPTPVVSVNDCLVIGDEIVFDSDLAAVINVRGVVIFAANKITVRPGARVTWSSVDFNPQTFDHSGDGANGKAGFPGHGSTWSNSPHPASKQGGKGEDGQPGSNGNIGPDAPSVVLIGLSIDRLPIMELRGYRGGNGGRGGVGGHGGAGDKGEPARCNWLGIREKGRGYGGDGGPGGNAGRGGHGGKGGAGGHVVVYCSQASLANFTHVPLDVQLQPGPGGDGGSAGVPGPGGPGGPQGDNCGIGDDTNGRNGFTGPMGHSDTTPPAQLRGPDGDLHGTLTLSPTSDAELARIMQEPAIVHVDPPTAIPDATVTLQCVHLPDATPQVRLTLGSEVRRVTVRRAGDGLSFTIPGDLPGGDYQLTLIDGRGSPLSTIAAGALTVVPSLTQVGGVGRWGTTLTLTGKGFSRGVRVFVGEQSYAADFIGLTTLRLTLPMPGGPFEQPAEVRPVCVTDARGRRSGTLPLAFEHWIHLGFQPITNNFAFENASGTLQAAKVDINPALYKETFGEDDFSVLNPSDLLSVIGDALNPLRAGRSSRRTRRSSNRGRGSAARCRRTRSTTSCRARRSRSTTPTRRSKVRSRGDCSRCRGACCRRSRSVPAWPR
jgi:hypothetical protein